MSNENPLFQQLIQNKKFLIALHRGAHGGSIIENTLNSVIVAKKEQVDIVEVDISRSTDGDFFMFHDGGEPRLLRESSNINELSTKEIESLYFYNNLDVKLQAKVERTSYFLGHLTPDTFINIDRSWDFWETFLDFLDGYEELYPYLILKSPVKKRYLDLLSDHKIKYMYFPIIYNEQELDLVETYSDINLVGFENIEAQNNYDFINSQRFEKYKNGHFLLMANSMNLDDDLKLFGELTDREALLKNPDLSWGKMIRMGINTIQTDWPCLLHQYRQQF